MIPKKLKSRLTRERESTSITVRIPVDVVDSLKKIAPLRGFSGYQALLKAYISDGLRKDEAELVFGPTARLAEALAKRGVSEEVIQSAVREARADYPLAPSR